MNRATWLLKGMAMGVLCVATSGCISRLASYDVVVNLDQSMGDEKGNLPSVELHLLGMTQADSQMMERRSMTEYWNPNRRQDSWERSVMQFGTGKETRQVLRYKDFIWTQWNRGGAERLVVLADLPGVFQDRDSLEDPRRLVIPLKRTRLWIKPRLQLCIRIDRNGVVYQPFAHESLDVAKRGDDIVRRAHEAR